MLNPPRKPEPKPTQLAKAVRQLLRGQSFALGILTGIALSVLERLFR